jgi:L-lactate dehydrogenase complex protein LldE
MRISLFITCYNDTLFPKTGQAVVRVLERLAHTIDFPAACLIELIENQSRQSPEGPLG